MSSFLFPFFGGAGWEGGKVLTGNGVKKGALLKCIVQVTTDTYIVR